jgi:antitoxin ParD1/3/4
LRDFVDSRTGDSGLYATPSEYLRDLIRKDMESQGVVAHVMTGLDDMVDGRFSDKSILDIGEED